VPLIAITLTVALATGAAESPVPHADDDGGDLLKLGRSIYREGIGEGGRAVQALVAHDVPFDGTQFTCESCHRRSGMGSSEGWLVAPIVTEASLYHPRTGGSQSRPAYTDETLARALREGVDSSGTELDPVMPRYVFSPREADGVIAYLKSLSSDVSPGVSEDSLHFATVITDGVDAAPMLEVLETYFRGKNNELRNPRRRAESGPFYRDNVNQAYRKWVLHLWRVEGPPETWSRQLETLYAEQPVFALISGIGSGDWRPVHEFCERHEIPALLPNTNRPAVSDADYYTLYFSMGLDLEARTVAEHLSKEGVSGSVVQVYREGSDGAVAAAAFRAAARTVEGLVVVERPLDSEQGAAPVVKTAIRDPATKVLLLWLDGPDLQALRSVVETSTPETDSPRIYLSSTLSNGDLEAIPVELGRVGFVLHPFALQDRFDSRFRRVESWLRSRGLEVRDRRLQAQTFYACMLTNEALMHVRFDMYYRDFFVEAVDHMTGIADFSVAYPFPSFGPGQRFLSKGCYVLHADSADWIVPVDRPAVTEP